MYDDYEGSRYDLYYRFQIVNGKIIKEDRVILFDYEKEKKIER